MVTRRAPSAGSGLLLLLLTGGCAQDKPVILIADAGNQRIVQMDDFSGAGRAAFTYPLVNQSFIGPASIAADSGGRIYASSLGDDRSPSPCSTPSEGPVMTCPGRSSGARTACRR
jgi:hypothetical protein